MESQPRQQCFAIAGDSDCDHERVGGLARDRGANGYYRCRDCGGVLIRADGAIPDGGPADAGPSDGSDDDGADREDLGTVDPDFGDVLADLEAHHADGGRQPSDSISTLGRLQGAWRRLAG